MGQMAPAFTLADLSGRPVSLETYRGRNVVQIVGWATWCAACRREIPRLVEAYEKHHADGFEILAITGSVGQDLGQVRSFAKKTGLPYPVLFDADSSVLERYRVYFVPYTCIVDRTGKIVYEGNHLPNDYEKRIEELLAQGEPA